MIASKVLVCGGREYTDRETLFMVLDRLHSIVTIGCVISGGARGADTLGEQWAIERRLAVMRFPAPWDTMKTGAGRVRNLWMLDYGRPDLVVAFPGGAGTADMISKARKACVQVQVIK